MTGSPMLDSRCRVCGKPTGSLSTVPMCGECREEAEAVYALEQALAPIAKIMGPFRPVAGEDHPDPELRGRRRGPSGESGV